LKGHLIRYNDTIVIIDPDFLPFHLLILYFLCNKFMLGFLNKIIKAAMLIFTIHK
jgi:hypothetical protein